MQFKCWYEKNFIRNILEIVLGVIKTRRVFFGIFRLEKDNWVQFYFN